MNIDIKELIEFCEARGEVTFDPDSTGDCMLAQFMKMKMNDPGRYVNVTMHNVFVYDRPFTNDETVIPIPSAIAYLIRAWSHETPELTFAAAAEELKTLL